jgi:hypothetical protein
MSMSCRCGLQELQQQGHLQLQHGSSPRSAAPTVLLGIYMQNTSGFAGQVFSQHQTAV